MNYTNDKEQIIFLKDADIARTIDGKTVSADAIQLNGVPSFDLFKEKYDELSTYDSKLCAYAAGFCADISNLSDRISADTKLSVENLQNQIISNDNDIEFLSGQHNQLSDKLSTTVKLSVENLQNQIISNDNDIEFLSGQHNWLSDELSADINALSDSLLADINQLSITFRNDVTYISNEVSSNDSDILNIQNYISSDNSLCTELSNVQHHYGKTFIEDTYELGPDKKVDVLKIVNSQDTNNKFKLIYLSGTLVLETL